MADIAGNAPANVAEPPTTATAAGPVHPLPLSFPAILRNPNFAHLNVHSAQHRQAASEKALPKKKDPRDKDGKRRVRRLENSKFSSNPHIVQPTKRDFAVPVARVQSTFPAPLPPYLPRVSSVPSGPAPTPDPASALAGKFSLSLRGLRRELRRRRGRAEPLVRAVEAELCEWLAEPAKPADVDDYVIVSGIREVRRSPGELVWDVDQDGFARYVVHCTARWYGVVSFSKEEPDGARLTHLLRPNPTRPDRSLLATPPTTDWDTASATGFSAFATDASEVESVGGHDNESIHGDNESVVSTDNVPAVPRVVMPLNSGEPGYDDEADLSGEDSWVALGESVASLTLTADDAETTLRTGRPAAIRDLSRESSRSPSRRPHARPKRRAVRPANRVVSAPVVFEADNARAGSLWDYLFAS
ncbi:hypothetical protein BDV93DRAFT_206127 [Ceratobasidium sp. AG-I]|nr:hypothetical protein BDV93DRAFT_206127 [Ceratobasidium sp. AG-I]